MAGFERALEELFAQAAPDSVLDVGCGEGVLTERWAQQLGSGRVVGIDLDDPKLQRRVGDAPAPEPRVPDHAGRGPAVRRAASSTSSPRSRCSSTSRTPSPRSPRWRGSHARHLLVSVPREPLWRLLNMARGAYVRELGNTPGHVNHWSKRGFVRLLARHGEVVEARSPFPWTMLLVRVG